MARQELFIDVFETDTFNEWRLKTNSIKLNLQDVYDELDALDDRVVLLIGNQTIDGVKSFVKKSIWTKEYTQNEVTPMLELKVTNSTFPHLQNIGHKGTGPAIDFYNPDTTTGGNTWLTSRIASITESNNDILPDASLVFYTGKNVEDIVEKMRITSSGNIGIGTSSPLEQLSIQTSTNNSVISIQSKDDKYAAISFGDSKSNKSGQIQYHNIDNSMRIFTGEYASNSSAERVRITSNGRVGVGTSSPSEKLDVVGNLKTTGWIEAASASGGVALTVNDGHGNAAVTFNHNSGKPTVDGSSGRIRCEVDNKSARMSFRLLDDVRANSSPYDLDEILALTTSKISLLKDTDITGKLYTGGKIGIREIDPDWDLCIGNKTTEAGHVALHADGGIISLRPLKNTTHAWMINAYDLPAAAMGVTSRKWNSAKNTYDDTTVLDFYSNNSVGVRNKLAVGGFTTSANGAPSSIKFSVRGSSDDEVSAQFRGAIQVNQFTTASRAYGFLSTNQGSAMVGGNLRLLNLTGEESNIGKTATVWITCDDQYKLYHNSTLIGEGTNWQNPGQHTFIVTGNDRIGVEAINTGGLYGLCYVIIIDGKVVFETNKTDIKASAGPFSIGWNVSNNLFNFGGSTPIDGTFPQIKQNLIAAVPGGDVGSAEVIWMPNGTEINQTYFFQGRLQEVINLAYQKGTNLRGSAAIQFIEGSNSTGQITFLRANDTNDDTYIVSESARFDENGRLGIGVVNPTQVLDVNGNIKGNNALFLTNDGYPQLILSDANQQTKRFGIWKENTNDQLAIGPQSITGSGTPALRVYRNATVDILKGGKVNTVLNDDKALVNKKWVEDTISTAGLVNIGGSDVFQATGDIRYSKGTYNLIASPLGNSIPEVGAGNHSHGRGFAGILTSTNDVDGGGLFLEVTDDNNDEHALSIYNTTQAVNKEVFHVRSTTGDTYSAGNIYARGGIGSETKLVIGDKDEYWSVQKSGSELRFVYQKGTTTNTTLKLTSSGQIQLEREGSSDKHLVTKKYVDNKVANATIETTTGSITPDKLSAGAPYWDTTPILYIGQNDSVNGSLFAYGGGAGNPEGGEIRLYTSADHDSTFDFYRLDAHAEYFRIGRAGKTDFIIDKYGNITSPGNITAKAPTSSVHLATKGYVDTQISSQISSGIFQATGNISYEEGSFNRIVGPTGQYIPNGIGNHSHGTSFIAKLESTSSSDGGGLFIDITDSNNDEHALSIYNTNANINKEVFHVRSATGDTYSAGDIYARGGIGTGLNFILGASNKKYWRFQNSSDDTNLSISHIDSGITTTALTLLDSGQVSLKKEGTSSDHLVTKKYVDDKVAAATTTSGSYKIVSGASYVGSYTNLVGSWNDTKNWFDVYPPSGFTMSDLEAFLPSIHAIHFAGIVDANDSIRCHHILLSDRIRVYVQNTEQRSVPAANWIAVWNK